MKDQPVATTYPSDAAADSDMQDGTGAGSADANRRQFARIRPDEQNGLAATLASGADIHLIDLSRGGAQFECDRRFLPNATVSLRLLTRDGQVLVTGRVVRSRIVRLASGGLGYLVAVAFTKPLQDGVQGVVEPRTAPSPVPSTVGGPPAASAQARPATQNAASDAGVSSDVHADISAEEALAFEAGVELAPTMLTVTAAIDSTSEQVHDMFNGNDW